MAAKATVGGGRYSEEILTLSSPDDSGFGSHPGAPAISFSIIHVLHNTCFTDDCRSHSHPFMPGGALYSLSPLFASCVLGLTLLLNLD